MRLFLEFFKRYLGTLDLKWVGKQAGEGSSQSSVGDSTGGARVAAIKCKQFLVGGFLLSWPELRRYLGPAERMQFGSELFIQQPIDNGR